MTETKFLDTTGLETLINEINKEFAKIKHNHLASDITGVLSDDNIPDSAKNVETYNTFASFPSVGRQNVLYISKQENKSYRWDDDNVKYYVVGSDYEDIEIINGGGAA